MLISQTSNSRLRAMRQCRSRDPMSGSTISSMPSGCTVPSASALTISESPQATVSFSLAIFIVLPPAAEPDFGAANDFVEPDGHCGEHGDEAEQLGRIEVFGEHLGEIADAGRRHVKLGQQHPEQHP